MRNGLTVKQIARERDRATDAIKAEFWAAKERLSGEDLERVRTDCLQRLEHVQRAYEADMWRHLARIAA